MVDDLRIDIDTYRAETELKKLKRELLRLVKRKYEVDVLLRGKTPKIDKQIAEVKRKIAKADRDAEISKTKFSEQSSKQRNKTELARQRALRKAIEALEIEHKKRLDAIRKTRLEKQQKEAVRASGVRPYSRIEEKPKYEGKGMYGKAIRQYKQREREVDKIIKSQKYAYEDLTKMQDRVIDNIQSQSGKLSTLAQRRKRFFQDFDNALDEHLKRFPKKGTSLSQRDIHKTKDDLYKNIFGAVPVYTKAYTPKDKRLSLENMYSRMFDGIKAQTEQVHKRTKVLEAAGITEKSFIKKQNKEKMSFWERIKDTFKRRIGLERKRNDGIKKEVQKSQKHFSQVDSDDWGQAQIDQLNRRQASQRKKSGGYDSDKILQMPQNKLLGRMAQFGMMASGMAATMFLMQMITAQIRNLMEIITSWEESILGIIDQTNLTKEHMSDIAMVLATQSRNIGITQTGVSEAFGASIQHGIAPTSSNIEKLYALNFSENVKDYKEAALLMGLAGTDFGDRAIETFTQKWDAYSKANTTSGTLGYEWEQLKGAGKESMSYVWSKDDTEYGKQLTDTMSNVSNWAQGNRQKIGDFFDTFVSGLKALASILKIVLPGITAFLAVFVGFYSLAMIGKLLTGISGSIMAMGIVFQKSTYSIIAFKAALQGVGAVMKSIGPAIIAMAAAFALVKFVQWAIDLYKYNKALKETYTLSSRLADMTSSQKDQEKYANEQSIEQARRKIQGYKDEIKRVGSGKTADEYQALVIKQEARIKRFQTAINTITEESARELQQAMENISGQNFENFLPTPEGIKNLERVNEELGYMPENLAIIKNVMAQQQLPTDIRDMGRGPAMLIEHIRKFKQEFETEGGAQSKAEYNIATSGLSSIEKKIELYKILRTETERALQIEEKVQADQYEGADLEQTQRLKDELIEINKGLLSLSWEDHAKNVSSFKKAFNKLRLTVSQLDMTDLEKQLSNLHRQFKGISIDKIEKYAELLKAVAKDKAIKGLADDYDKLTLSTIEYKKLKLNEWFAEQAGAIGGVTKELQAIYDEQLKLIEAGRLLSSTFKNWDDKYLTDKEVRMQIKPGDYNKTKKLLAGMDEDEKETSDWEEIRDKTIKELSDSYNELTMSAAEYKKLKLSEWFNEQEEAIGGVTKELQALYDEQLKQIEAGRLLSSIFKNWDNEYLTDKEVRMQINQSDYDKTKKIIEQSNKDKKDLLDSETKAIEKELEKQRAAYEHMYNEIHDIAADFWNSALDGQMKSWEDFMDYLLDSFKKTFAQILAKASTPILMNISQSVLGSFGIGGGGSNIPELSGLSGLGDSFSGMFSSTSITGQHGVPGIYSVPSATTAGGLPSGFSMAGGLSSLGNLAGAGIFAFVASKIMENFSKPDDPRFGVYGTAKDYNQFDQQSSTRGDVLGYEYTKKTYPSVKSEKFDYEVYAEFFDGKESEISDTVFNYFDTIFTKIEEATEISIDDVLKDYKYMGEDARVTDNFEQSFEDLSAGMFDTMLGGMLLSLMPDAGSIDKIIKTVVGSQQVATTKFASTNIDPRSGNIPASTFDRFNMQPASRTDFDTLQDVGVHDEPIYEDITHQVSAMADTFNKEFFDAISIDGSNEWDSFIRFGTVVNDASDFLDDFTNRIENLGESSAEAFLNIEAINAIMDVIDTGLEQITDSSVLTNLETMNESWANLIESLTDANAILEDITAAEDARSQAIGAQISGITADSMQGALASESSIKDLMRDSIQATLAADLSEAFYAKYFEPANKAITALFDNIEMSSEDQMLAMNDIVANIDFDAMDVGAQNLQDSMNDMFGASVEAAEELADALASALLMSGDSYSAFLDPLLREAYSPEVFDVMNIQDEAKALRDELNAIELFNEDNELIDPEINQAAIDEMVAAITEIEKYRIGLEESNNLLKVGGGQADLLGIGSQWTMALAAAKYASFGEVGDLGETQLDLDSVSGLQELVLRAASGSFEALEAALSETGIGFDEMFSDMSSLSDVLYDITHQFDELASALDDYLEELTGELLSTYSPDKREATARQEFMKVYNDVYSSDTTVALEAMALLPEVSRAFLTASKASTTDLFAYRADAAMVSQIVSEVSEFAKAPTENQMVEGYLADLAKDIEDNFRGLEVVMVDTSREEQRASDINLDALSDGIGNSLGELTTELSNSISGDDGLTFKMGESIGFLTEAIMGDGSGLVFQLDTSMGSLTSGLTTLLGGTDGLGFHLGSMNSDLNTLLGSETGLGLNLTNMSTILNDALIGDSKSLFSAVTSSFGTGSQFDLDLQGIIKASNLIGTSIKELFADDDFFGVFKSVFETDPFEKLKLALDALLLTFPASITINVKGGTIGNDDDDMTRDQAQTEFSRMRTQYEMYGWDDTSGLVDSTELDRIKEWTDEYYKSIPSQFDTPYDALVTWQSIKDDMQYLLSIRDIAGYAAGGISYGPTSGYPVTLHGTEAVIPLSRGSVPVEISNTQDVALERRMIELISENKIMRKHLYQIDKNMLKLYSLADKDDRIGVPPERDA